MIKKRGKKNKRRKEEDNKNIGEEDSNIIRVKTEEEENRKIE